MSRTASEEFNFDQNRSVVDPIVAEFSLNSYSEKEFSFLLRNSLNKIYSFVDADEEDHFVFASNHAEAINHVIFSTYVDVTVKTGKNHFITSAIDEAPQIMGMSRMQSLGNLFDMASANRDGIVTVEAIKETITPRTVLVSLSYANALTGVLQPIDEIAELCKERGILLHVDVTNLIGKKRISFSSSSFDFMTFNTSALHAEMGGGFFIKKEHAISPFIMGGSEQGGLRGGNYDRKKLLGLAKVLDSTEEEIATIELSRLRDHFEEKILEHIPEAKILFRNSLRAPHITLIDFPKISSETLLYFLNKNQLYAMSGGGHHQKIVHILKACHTDSHSSLSFSLNKFLNEDQIQKAAQIIGETYHKLKVVAAYL